MDLEKALQLLSLPREVGEHPEDGKMITAGLGRYGPFVLHDGTYANLSSPDEVFSVGINRAVDALAEKRAKGGGRRGAAATPLKELGEHPSEGGPVNVYDGRYGPYVKHGKVNATLPKDTAPEAVTMELAVELIAAKGGTKKKAAAKKTPAKKTTAKKTTTKKAAAKDDEEKTTSKKPAAKKTAAKKTTAKSAAKAEVDATSEEVPWDDPS
jgi:DNA topoisomerase-1